MGILWNPIPSDKDMWYIGSPIVWEEFFAHYNGSNGLPVLLLTSHFRVQAQMWLEPPFVCFPPQKCAKLILNKWFPLFFCDWASVIFHYLLILSDIFYFQYEFPSNFGERSFHLTCFKTRFPAVLYLNFFSVL